MSYTISRKQNLAKLQVLSAVKVLVYKAPVLNPYSFKGTGCHANSLVRVDYPLGMLIPLP